MQDRANDRQQITQGHVLNNQSRYILELDYLNQGPDNQVKLHKIYVRHRFHF